MRIVAALGGNALLKRGERPDSDVQEHNVEIAIAALAPLARDHELVITHGNGPQVGVLALESASDPALSHPFPLDTLGAETQGLIGYWLAQELQNHLPDRMITAIVTQTVVDRDDPGFAHPTKFVGPVYDEAELRTIADERGWTISPDGDRWRRVVASPKPVRIVETPAIRLLLEAGALVVCAGGGGIPVIEGPGGKLTGVEAVIDKDLTTALLAEQLDADAFLVLTDVDGVYREFGTPNAERIATTTVADLRQLAFPAGSMGPKIDAVCRFVEHTDGFAAIGTLADATAILAGTRGTRVQHREVSAHRN
jgi:carbamate kinase